MDSGIKRAKAGGKKSGRPSALTIAVLGLPSASGPAIRLNFLVVLRNLQGAVELEADIGNQISNGGSWLAAAKAKAKGPGLFRVVRSLPLRAVLLDRSFFEHPLA